MPRYKRHLRRKRRGGSACGLPGGKFFTSDPAEVTCGACQRTVYMADAEARLALKSQSKRRRERRGHE